jgi:hypothetical protein
MSVATTLAGVAQMDLATLAPQQTADPFVAAFPTFSHVNGPGQTTTSDAIALLRKSAASPPTARQLGAAGLTFWDAADVPMVFKALNPMNTTGSPAFPTFILGQSGLKHYMDVVTIRSAHTMLRIPLTSPGFQNMNDAQTVMAAAHVAAIDRGFVTGFPTFQIEPATPSSVAVAIVVAFGPAGAAVSPAPGGGGRRWTFSSLPAINDGGLALVATGTAADPTPVLFNGFDATLWQFSPTVPESVSVDPAPGGRQLATSPLLTQMSAVTDGTTVDVIWSGPALFHASRPAGSSAAFTTETISGATSPDPTGYVGYFNHLLRSPGNALHAFAYLSAPAGVDPGAGPVDQSTCFNLMHFLRTSAGWSPNTVDGDRTSDGHIITDVGQTMSAAFEPNGRLHAFYPSSIGSTIGNRLRHAEFDGTVWTAETLDGAGGGSAVGGPGTGRISAAVGTAPTSVFFDSALWVVYQDLTNGNLRCAHGVRDAQGLLQWDFHLMDGNARRGSTGGVVQSAVALVRGTTLSVIYGDLTNSVIRHAFRSEGETAWRFELLDGAGGADGRVAAPTRPQIAATVGGRNAAGRPDLPVFVSYLMNDPAEPGRGIRLATLA